MDEKNVYQVLSKELLQYLGGKEAIVFADNNLELIAKKLSDWVISLWMCSESDFETISSNLLSTAIQNGESKSTMKRKIALGYSEKMGKFYLKKNLPSVTQDFVDFMIDCVEVEDIFVEDTVLKSMFIEFMQKMR